VRAVTAEEAAGPFDVVIAGIKVWQIPPVGDALRRLVGPGTAVIGLQNGVDAAEILGREVGPAHVLGGTCRIISLMPEPGLIRHLGADPVITFGEPAGGRSERTAEIERALDLGPVARTVASDDIASDLWRKFLFLEPTSSIGSLTRSSFGAVRAEPETWGLLESAIREVYQLAKASGAHLAPESVERTLAFIETLPPAGTASMQRDFDEGRRTELEALPGAVVRIGRMLGVATPVHDVVYAALLPLERRAVRAAEG
jgi:2-dehydropantoate 2-reductase